MTSRQVVATAASVEELYAKLLQTPPRGAKGKALTLQTIVLTRTRLPRVKVSRKDDVYIRDFWGWSGISFWG